MNPVTQPMPGVPQDFQVAEESIESVSRIWQTDRDALKWNCLFTLPVWMDAWIESFGDDVDARIFAVKHGKRLLGLAPLQISRDRAAFIGSADLCDYLDFIVAAGRERDFFSALLAHLHRLGIHSLELGPLRPDSTAFRNLPGVAEKLGWHIQQEEDELSFEMDLPKTWDDYLAGLSGKQRHEVRRKIRRLAEKAEYGMRTVRSAEALGDHLDVFIDLFRQSGGEKSGFLTAQRLMFFRLLAEKMAAAAMLKLCFLDIDGEPAAGALCFEDADTLYLYNSGYDQRFAGFSAGQLCVVMTIRDGIANGRKGYNFLKGDEVYKKRLGGRPVKLMRLRLGCTPA